MTLDAANLEVHRPALTGHCYRMLGSAFDADDAVQETMIRAWKNLDQFDGRASVKTWLYRIATNVCLDALRTRTRRGFPLDESAPGSATPAIESLAQKPGGYWIQPVADSRAVPSTADPAERAMLRQSIRLAFVAALQHLAPRQRAALLLTEVLGCSAAETAETLETSVAAVNSALQRARSVLAKRNPDEPAELTETQRGLLSRYAAAFENYDVDGLMTLMRQDVTFSMPPYSHWLQGPENVRAWLLGLGSGCRGSRLIPVQSTCSWPAFAQYRVNPDEPGGHKAWALVVLELAGDRVAGITSFLDTAAIFPRFDLPLILSPER